MIKDSWWRGTAWWLAVPLSALVGSAAAGCGTTDDSGAGGKDHAGAAPSESVTEARQALSPTPICISISRTGASGTVFDAQIANKVPPKNYGSAETMNTGLFGTGNEQRQSLVQFDLSAIPSTANGSTSIVSATVALQRGLLTPTGIDVVTVHRVTSAWLESTVTWQSFGGAFDPQVEASFSNAATSFTFDITPLATAWFQGQLPNYGILLDQANFASNFWSSDRSDVTVRPRLDVCYTQACNAGFADCNNDPTDGCEVDLNTNLQNCGACATACSTPANGTAACVAGVCGIASCNGGFADCNNNPADGCETTPASDVNHCGACNNACSTANGTPSCTAGVCTSPTCNAGFADCNNNPSDGCEINTNTNASNCGSCGNVCSSPNATAQCTSGACTLGACNAGFANCNGNAADGCEINTNTNASNCGSCGHVCSLPNATAACSAGGCVIASCNAGFADCDGNPANGCEVNLNTDSNHCGSCATVCGAANGSAACAAGTCQITACNAGFANCDGVYANGCEVNTTNSANNCGACGNTCSAANGTAACSASTCQVAACNPGFADCNGVYADGCEINTTNNPLNCGACNAQCNIANGTASCSASTCQVAACNSGFGNCDGNPTNGCETNLATNTSNCGTCGNNCATACSSHVSGTTCSAGACSITACQAGFFNVDGTCSDGCECQANLAAQTCASASPLGTINIGQTVTTTHNLVPTGVDGWYTVTFASNTNFSYHPRVRLTQGASEFAFDVVTSCAGNAIACGTEGGTATGKTDWEVFYAGGDPNDPGTFNPIPAVGSGGTVLIHVYRRSGQALTCNNYTLTISN